jgi:hypothetical protein
MPTPTNNLARARSNRAQVESLPAQLAELDTMNVTQLTEKYRQLYGEPTRTRNKPYLKKRLTWRLQELAHGGLSQTAIERITQLGGGLPERWRIRHAETREQAKEAEPVAQVVQHVEPRDSRIPPVGTILRRAFGGEEHDVTVCPTGFEYRGAHYKTLSAIAKHIAGTPWNGFSFFGINKRDGEPQ